MFGFQSEYVSTVIALSVLYPLATLAITFLPQGRATEESNLKAFLERFTLLNFAAGFVATCGPALFPLDFGPGGFEPFGATLRVLTQSSHPFNSLPGLLVLLNALLFFPAGFFSALSGWSVTRSVRTSLKVSLMVEILQLLALHGSASVDDLLLNGISGLLGVLAGKAIFWVWSGLPRSVIWG